MVIISPIAAITLIVPTITVIVPPPRSEFQFFPGIGSRLWSVLGNVPGDVISMLNLKLSIQESWQEVILSFSVVKMQNHSLKRW